MFIVNLILYAVIGVVALVATRYLCRYVIGPAYRKGRDKRKFQKAYMRLGGMPYIPKKLCADKNPKISKWFGEKFWEGPPAPKANDIEAWDKQQLDNKVARERAHMEVYGVSYPHA